MSPTSTASRNSFSPPLSDVTPPRSQPSPPLGGAAEPAPDQPDFRLPNIRKMFIPDPGKVIVDADLAGADAQVVAWEADDAKLKATFKAGQSVHLMNGEDLLGSTFTNAVGHHKNPGTQKGRMYEALKRFVHGTNYLSSARNLHLNPAIAWPLAECISRQGRWFT